MKTRNLESQNWKVPKRIFLVFLVFIFVLFIRYVYLSLSPKIDGIDLQKFSTNRNTYKSTIYAKRGTIYDNDNNILAVNMASYTVIAYLDESRSKDSDTPLHVVDKGKTAEALSSIINMSKEDILHLLNLEGLYQVELGPGGRNITELQKDMIEELELPGIDFINSTKRYYPNGNFASYLIGYAKINEIIDNLDNITYSIDGELGIEGYYDDILKGQNGFLEYEQDNNGYKIPDTKEYIKPAVNGKDIYLTIDSSIQRFLESAISKASVDAKPEWMLLSIMDAKTGDILGSSTSPSFDPNILDIENYENLLVSNIYEPGSTMKTYTYICALEKGTYDGSKTFKSGNIKIENDTIYDVYKPGWGNISYDEGYLRSSNVGVSYMVNEFIDKNDLKECLDKYGFGQLTNIELPREFEGNLEFNYPLEVASAAFGQGISITAIQALRGITLISNDGKLLSPHIISKIVDVDTGNIEYERQVEESEPIISISTVEYMKNLMYKTVNGEASYNYYGNGYDVDGIDLIGKTGTAQIYDPNLGRYLNGEYDYIYSFIGMFPKDDPEIIIYGVMKRPQVGGNASLKTAIKDTLSNISKYKNMSNNESKTLSSIKLKNYVNRSLGDAKAELEKYKMNVVVLGDGEKVIKTYPKENSTLVENDRVILVTNSENIKMPSIINWSNKEVNYFCNNINIPCNIIGEGFVSSQSIKEGTILKDDTLTIELKSKITN